MDVKNVIGDTTMALEFFAHEKFQTKIYDEFGIFYSTKTPRKLIDEYCVIKGSTFEGRKKAVYYLTKYTKCPPIPVDPSSNMIAIPTKAITAHDCTWIFSSKVSRIEPLHNKSIVIFRNGIEIIIDSPVNVMKRKWEKAAYCMMIFPR